MKTCEFYAKLGSVSTTFNWEVSSSQALTTTGKRGMVKGIKLNPVTAVAYKTGKGIYASNKRDTLKAGKALGLTKTFSENLYQASTNYSNRGHSQVVRGRILSALEM